MRSARTLFRLMAIVAILAGTLALGPAWAAAPLSPDERKVLTEALAKLDQAHEAIRGTVTDCDGGMISVLACQPPRPGSRTVACGGPGGSCDVVAAMRDAERAADALRKALGQ